MVLLSVIIRLSDEPYKVNAVKMYMVDYLDNICAFRLRRQRTSERESIDVIAAESSAKSAFQTEVQESEQEDAPAVSKAASGKSRSRGILRSSSKAEAQEARGREVRAQESRGQEARAKVSRAVESGDPEEVKYAETDKESRLSINIEGEPRTAEKGEAARQAVRRAVNERNEEEDRPVLREETIRQILEEFLA